MTCTHDCNQGRNCKCAPKRKATWLALLLAIFGLQGCAVVAANEVGLQQFLLVTATVATSEAAYMQTKQLMAAPTTVIPPKPTAD